MGRLKHLAVCLGLILGMTTTVEAAHPRYLILTTPSARGRHMQGSYPGQAQRVSAGAYAWGWFGARPYSHSVRHRDYYNSAWVWGQ